MEIWKDIKGYEGIYQISSLGNVKSLYGWDGHAYITREKILHPAPTTTGYYKVKLVKDGHRKDHKIHRLVADAFISNPMNKKQVNHKDGNKLNNDVNNLEWCTASENSQHSYQTGLKKTFYISKSHLESLYREGLCARDIANMVGTTPTIIYGRLRRYDIERRNPSECRDKYHVPLNELLIDFQSGKSNKELSQKYNCTSQLIATRKTQFRKRGLLL